MEDNENINPSADNIANLQQLSMNINFEDTPQALVFFDLETSGFERTCDILQIGARFGNQLFSKYIQPQYDIPANATSVNQLTNVGNDMFFRGQKVASYPLRTVLEEFLEFLKNCGRKNILIAHNSSFDAPRLVRIIKEAQLQDEFSNVIEGFVDTLSLFRKKFPKTSCKLETLARKFFTLDNEQLHDAPYDAIILQNVAFLHLTTDELTSNVKDFRKMVELSKNLQSLEPLRNSISHAIRRRMAFEGINYELLCNAYQEGRAQAIELLEKRGCNGKKVIRTKKNLNIILSHLEKVE